MISDLCYGNMKQCVKKITGELETLEVDFFLYRAGCPSEVQQLSLEEGWAFHLTERKLRLVDSVCPRAKKSSQMRR